MGSETIQSFAQSSAELKLEPDNSAFNNNKLEDHADLEQIFKHIIKIHDRIQIFMMREIEPPEVQEPFSYLDACVRMYRQRRMRSSYFSSRELFGEPAWDILLDLFIAGEEQKKISISSACIAADMPMTTALRWLRLLEKEGLVLREDDPQDNRRAYVALTPVGRCRIANYLRRCADI